MPSVAGAVIGFNQQRRNERTTKTNKCTVEVLLVGAGIVKCRMVCQAKLDNALREWQVTELSGDYYQMLNASDGDIVTLFRAFGIDVPAKIYTKGDLRELKSNIDPF